MLFERVLIGKGVVLTGVAVYSSLIFGAVHANYRLLTEAIGVHWPKIVSICGHYVTHYLAQTYEVLTNRFMVNLRNILVAHKCTMSTCMASIR